MLENLLRQISKIFTQTLIAIISFRVYFCLKIALLCIFVQVWLVPITSFFHFFKFGESRFPPNFYH